MKENKTRAALLLIDMENAFVEPEGAHCIEGARATIPACVRSLNMAREKNIPVFFVKRIYRANGSDVELSRYSAWQEGGRGCSPASVGKNSAEAPDGLRPQPGDYTIIKPRWSAFFGTELDLILRRLGVRTLFLAGTTTPNCIRTTAYDALALDYNTVVLTDCTSSQTEEIQRANLEDMARVGVQMMSSADFAAFDGRSPSDMLPLIRAEIENSEIPPEQFERMGTAVIAPDRW